MRPTTLHTPITRHCTALPHITQHDTSPHRKSQRPPLKYIYIYICYRTSRYIKHIIRSSSYPPICPCLRRLQGLAPCAASRFSAAKKDCWLEDVETGRTQRSRAEQVFWQLKVVSILPSKQDNQDHLRIWVVLGGLSWYAICLVNPCHAFYTAAGCYNTHFAYVVLDIWFCILQGQCCGHVDLTKHSIENLRVAKFPHKIQLSLIFSNLIKNPVLPKFPQNPYYSAQTPF